MSTSVPQVPPRPTRAQKETPAASAPLRTEMPLIPPRPAGRRNETSISPSRESFARSPLNEAPSQGIKPKSSLGSNGHGEGLSTEQPQRPPSVVLPSLGQEGNEYAEVFAVPEKPAASKEQTHNVANDLQLHAPKPSLPVSSAKQRVSTVTRTDSKQAASFGIGKVAADDKDPAGHPLKAKASIVSQNDSETSGTQRPPSSLDNEQGIPEIGQRVPMYPNAGDVQAPSPSPFPQPYAPGIGFHNDGSKPRNHSRKLSGNPDVPLEAYGRHGHQILPHHHNHFEKAYYEKHPELFKKELGQYGEGRPEWAMSSEDLNKIVRDTASRGTGLGNSPAFVGTPTEQVGIQAHEEYASRSRISSPKISPTGLNLAHSNSSQTHVDSPLGKEIHPDDSSLGRSQHAPSDLTLGSENESDDVIHVDLARTSSRVYGHSNLGSVEDFGPASGNGYEEAEPHYSAPILASDELAKDPFGYEMQPAVSPMHERKQMYHEEGGFYQHKSSSQTSLTNSRPTSIHGNVPGLHVPPTSTKLEDLEEYEPLFPEDDKNKDKPLTAADKLKRPELKNRKFPSQDIWEDTPHSLQYTATVSSPQLPDEDAPEKEKPKEAPTDETPERAFARRQEELAEKELHDRESFLHKEKKPWGNKSHVVSETRPELKQRFPSRDIWEDTPDSLQLQTTVNGPQTESEAPSVPEERPTTGAVVYHQEKAAAGLELGSEEGRATTGVAALMKPSIPARPKTKLSESSPVDKQPPSIPERPRKFSDSSPPVPTKTKPVIPARPSKSSTRESSEHAPLTKVTSNSSTKSIGSDQGAVAKSKPPVPSRPVGGKIAALQGGFMSDLNKRLQLGPQAPKKEEVVPEETVVEKEKVPLADARKGRARGPARRAPAKSSAPAAAITSASASAQQTAPVLGFSIPSTLWEIDPEENTLQVVLEKEPVEPVAPIKAASLETPKPATNTPEKVAAVEVPEIAEKATEVQTESAPEKDDSPVAAKTISAPEVIEDEDMTGSTATLKAKEEEHVE
ncbi:hypothetical protein HYFRA_00013307 [Hymenoscyphus fraxineus]|uniref:Altered inheritance of mitochondria protein 21 n=1 Tax=Hymenoscyphus fraxineus TaxID=746836 RepID=A0A9N9PVD9_9HELO|nr:hypothetical protein HYFRA_00013307 [Hymenoscyphus fraxineus]